jgi:hypothetical protein
MAVPRSLHLDQGGEGFAITTVPFRLQTIPSQIHLYDLLEQSRRKIDEAAGTIPFRLTNAH